MGDWREAQFNLLEPKMSLLLPVDDNGNPMQVLGFASAGTTKLQVTSTSVSTDLPGSEYKPIQLITLIATGPCRFAIGAAGVTADLVSSPYLHPGIYVDVPLRRGDTEIAFIAESEDCVAFVIGRA
jgi:hypothetical protein